MKKKIIIQRIIVIQFWNLFRLAFSLCKLPILYYSQPYFAKIESFINMAFTFFVWAGTTLIMVLVNIYVMVYVTTISVKELKKKNYADYKPVI
jgi:hypothetical protein